MAEQIDLKSENETEKENNLYCYFGNVKAELVKKDGGYNFNFIFDENTTKEDMECIKKIDEEIQSIIENKGTINLLDLMDELSKQ